MEKKIVAALTHTKGLVILGFVFIGAAVVMRLQTPAARPIVTTPEPTPSPVEALNMLAKATQVSTKPKLDINGTYECKYASISAQLSKKQLYAVNSSGPQPTYTLFKDDCLYTWKKNARTGVKKCGLGQYVSMYEMMSSMGMGDAGDMISTVLDSGIADGFLASPAAATGKTYTIGGDKQKQPSISQSLVTACKPTRFIAPATFELPKTVTFTEPKQK